VLVVVVARRLCLLWPMCGREALHEMRVVVRLLTMCNVPTSRKVLNQTKPQPASIHDNHMNEYVKQNTHSEQW